jgi:hypothetical protein
LYCNSYYLIKAFKRNIPMSFEIKIIALWATNLSVNVDFILLLRCLISASMWRIIRYNPTNFRFFLAADICQEERYLFHLISAIFTWTNTKLETSITVSRWRTNMTNIHIV